MSEPFVGEVRCVGFNFNPMGWAFCDGQLLAISQNTALFSLLGTFYGGDGKAAARFVPDAGSLGGAGFIPQPSASHGATDRAAGSG